VSASTSTTAGPPSSTTAGVGERQDHPRAVAALAAVGELAAVEEHQDQRWAGQPGAGVRARKLARAMIPVRLV